jgi:hypothetical protein
MLETITKYWVALTFGALAVVSVFNIGYFSVVGLHFIGVMDLSNIVYSVGFVAAMIIIFAVFFPHQIVVALQEVAARPDAMPRLQRIAKIVFVVLAVAFTIGLFIHRPYISIVGLFAVYFVLAYLALGGYAYGMLLHFGKPLPWRFVCALVAGGLFTVLWVGAAVAYNQAAGTTTLYNVTTKDAEFGNVRLVRSSSSGFIISRDKQIIYIPAGELKKIMQVGEL